MNMKKLVVVSLLGASVLGMAGSANAYCYRSGKVERVTQYNSGAYIYMTPSNTSLTSSYYNYTYTTDPEVQTAAHNALNTDQEVYVRAGTSTSKCPTSGTARYMGTTNYITRY